MNDSTLWRHTTKEPTVLGIHVFAWVFLVLLGINPFKYDIIVVPLAAAFIGLSALSLYGGRKGVSLPVLLNIFRFRLARVVSYNTTLMRDDLYEECRAIHHL